MAQVSRIHSDIGPRQVRPFKGFDAKDYASLTKLGIDVGDTRQVQKTFAAFSEHFGEDEATGMDALQPTITTPSIPAYIQFLQTWLPGFVQIQTAPRKIDMIVGITTAGAWEDEEIVQGIMELTGSAVPYGDYSNVPLASWNLSFAERSVVRFEEGLRVGLLEDARASRMKINSAAAKREAAAKALDIQRNSVGFYGYNGGANLTYGLLNDPGEGAYTVFPNGATSGSPSWSTKTFQDMQKDLRLVMQTLRVQSAGEIDPTTEPVTVVLPVGSVDFLTVTTDQGISVMDWLKKNYPNTRIIDAPEMATAHAGANALYAFIESVSDTSTDDGKTFMQIVPAKFKTLGTQQMVKGFIEDYGNALAGIWCKRPFALVRFYGL